VKVSEQIKFFIKSCVIFSVLSFGFSLTGLLFPDDSYIIGNPLIVSSPTLEHIFGHVAFGIIAGAISLSLRYVFLSGALALLVDADHLLQFLDVEMISRMVHSLPFAIIIAVIMLYVFGKKTIVWPPSHFLPLYRTLLLILGLLDRFIPVQQADFHCFLPLHLKFSNYGD